MRTLLTCALIAGCNANDPDTKRDGGPDDPAPYIVDGAQSPVATVSLGEIERAVQEAVDEVLHVNPDPVRASYDAAMLGADPSCPYFYEDANGRYWYDDCTTSTGTSFTGYVFSEYGDGVYDAESGMEFDYWYASGGATIADAEGRVLDVGGLAYRYEARGTDGSIQFYGAIQGGFGWNGPEARNTWLESRYDPDLEMTAATWPELGGRYVILDGGLGGLGGDGLWAASFDQVLLFNDVVGSACEDEPSGTLSVRAPDGTWYDMRFHGPDGSGIVPEGGRCDGCGEAYFLGELLGEVCVDFSTLLGWEDSPW